MMEPAVHGNPLTTPLLREINLTRNNQGVWQAEVVYNVKEALAVKSVPANGTALAEYPGLFLYNVAIAHVDPDYARITLSYQGTAPFSGDISTPPNELEFSGATIERPIQQHPSFDDEDLFPKSTKIFRKVEKLKDDGSSFDPKQWYPEVFDQFADDSAFAGITSYDVGSTRCIVTTYHTTPPKVEDGLGLGKKISPPGLTQDGTLPADPHYWLLVSLEKQKRGTFWVLRREFLFSGFEAPWPAEIYDLG